MYGERGPRPEPAKDIAAEIKKTIENPEVTAADIRATPPDVDGTKIILQRHEKYQRTPDEHGEGLGSLTPESTQKAYDQTEQILEEMLGSLSPEERRSVHFLTVGSNTRHRQQGMRSMETASQVLASIRDHAEALGVTPDHILNNRSRDKGVAPIGKMQAPRMFDDSTEYVARLEERYGEQTQEFWKAFEEDTHRDTRIELGAEGPDEIDARFTAYLSALAKFAESFHRDNPGSRLVIWGVSHYDTISPYIKRHVTKTDPHQYLAVDYGAGISIEIDAQGRATSTFQGQEHEIELTP